MRILILGGNGMIGHKMYQVLSQKYNDTWVTLRTDLNLLSYKDWFNKDKVIDNFEINDSEKLKKILDQIDPTIIINAVGVTIRRGVNNCISNSLFLNSVLPHLLNEWVENKSNKRLIHFSTDCVFSGKSGRYTENSITDANDIYGKSKALGEAVGKHTLILRGSMIGRELDNHTELLEWFLTQNKNTVKGFSNVIYSGITTIRMAEYVKNIISDFPSLNGIYNVSSHPISKYDLLLLFKKTFNLDVQILKENDYYSSKDLISSKFYTETKISIPSWESLVIQLNEDSILYKGYYKN